MGVAVQILGPGLKKLQVDSERTKSAPHLSHVEQVVCRLGRQGLCRLVYVLRLAKSGDDAVSSASQTMPTRVSEAGWQVLWLDRTMTLSFLSPFWFDHYELALSTTLHCPVPRAVPTWPLLGLMGAAAATGISLGEGACILFPRVNPQALQWGYLSFHLLFGWHKLEQPHARLPGLKRGKGPTAPAWAWLSPSSAQFYTSPHPPQ